MESILKRILIDPIVVRPALAQPQSNQLSVIIIIRKMCVWSSSNFKKIECWTLASSLFIVMRHRIIIERANEHLIELYFFKKSSKTVRQLTVRPYTARTHCGTWRRYAEWRKRFINHLFYDAFLYVSNGVGTKCTTYENGKGSKKTRRAYVVQFLALVFFFLDTW